MLFSFAVIILVGLAMAGIIKKVKFPGIIGMFITGIIISPYALDLLDPTILNISAELRQIALIIILIKAGLLLDLAELKKVGRPAVLMAFMPACFEIIGYFLFAPILFGINRIEAIVMGAVLSAVSPAVVIPGMVKLMEEKRGVNKNIPQMILAGASCDDIFVIVLFSTFMTMSQGGSTNFVDFINIPVSIIGGIIFGIITGFILCSIFEMAYKRNCKIRNSTKVIIILATAFLLMSLENICTVSGVLAIVIMACVIKMKMSKKVLKRLSEKFGKLWIFAEVLLFVLVGATINIRYTLNAGIEVVEIIFITLMFRSVGVWLCMIKTKLNIKERIFCIIAYLPKATVQAAIGSIPLSLGLPCGEIILSVAVVAIIITAPLGAIGIDKSYKKLLDN